MYTLYTLFLPPVLHLLLLLRFLRYDPRSDLASSCVCMCVCGSGKQKVVARAALRIWEDSKWSSGVFPSEDQNYVRQGVVLGQNVYEDGGRASERTRGR